MTTEGRGGDPTALLTVAHRGGDRFRIRGRGHEIDVDQPVGDGGEDTAPTPTELFVAGLASCVVFYARRYLARHGLSATGSKSRPGTRPVADPRASSRSGSR
jgi:putative redox protein